MHPHVFFDSLGVEELRTKVLGNARLSKVWQRFKVERVDSSFLLEVGPGELLDLDLGRAYGDALADLTLAYIVLQDSVYLTKVINMMSELSAKSAWGNALIKGHISIGFAFAWDGLFNHIPDSLKATFRDAILRHGNNNVPNDVYGNINWTASAGEGLLGLAFRGDGDADFNGFVEKLLIDAKLNYKEKDRSVLWAHGSDGFPHQGLGYWRKYIHAGLFLSALRRQEPQNDWFHLGKEFPGSEFLQKTGYARIYADMPHEDLETLTWADSRQVRAKPGLGPYGNIGLVSILASEYKDGYLLDFFDYLVDERQARFADEDWATFLLFDDTGIVPQSYRDLPLSRYWPDMEAAIFRSGWDQDDMVFYMRSGSPGGHSRFLKSLSPGGHDHPDANGFVIFYDNDYLAAEDGVFPHIGPDTGNNKITYGHNTFLIDGLGQKGDRTTKPLSTTAHMDYLDSEHVGYLMGDATDAYESIDKFHRYVIYKKHKYFVMVDELSDPAGPHKYEYLLGTDNRHFLVQSSPDQFTVTPRSGSAKLPVTVVEPRAFTGEILPDRPYSIDVSLTDMLHLSPVEDAQEATFFTVHYPQKLFDAPPLITKIYEDDLGISGVVVDDDEFHLHNKNAALYTYAGLTTDARLCYFKDNLFEFEYLTTGSREFLYRGQIGIRSSAPVVASFKETDGSLRVDAAGAATEITLFYPGILDVEVDGQIVSPTVRAENSITFTLSPKTFEIGPSRFEQVVTDNYSVRILAPPALQLISPNGGELLSADSSQVIMWSSNGLFARANLQYSVDGGVSWKTIADSVDNSGTYNWLVPDERSDNALVRVTNADGPLPVDVSDGQFSIDRAPEISGIQPALGPVGSQVAIRGVGFARVTRVAFGLIPATTYIVVSDSLMNATVPEGAATSPVLVTNRIATGASPGLFEVITSPVILSFTPDSGPVGTEVTVAGKNFISVGNVTFNSTPADSFLLLADSLLTVIVPTGAHSGRVKVSSAIGVGESTSDFTVKLPPVIYSVDPAQGPVGARIAINGESLSEVFSVTFGSVAATDIEVLSDSLISVAVPAGAESGGIRVENPFGAATSEVQFLVTVAPIIETLLPMSGPVGTQVIIRGRHFLGSTTVAFGDAEADYFSVQSDSVIVATVPPGAETGRVAVVGSGEISTSPIAFVVYLPIRTTIFQPTQDTYSHLVNTTENFGTRTKLKVESGGFVTYLKFNVNSISGSIQSTHLRLFAESTSTDAGSIYNASNSLLFSSTPWTEINLTAQNAPAVLGTALDSIGSVVSQTRALLDVSAEVLAEGEYSFAIVSESSDLAEFSSREGAAPPELIVTAILEPNLLPTIQGFTPQSAEPGEEVVISGTRLNEVTRVRFNQRAARDFEIESFTRLRVRVPDDARSGPISVANYAGTVRSATPFDFIRVNLDTTFVYYATADAFVRSAEPTRNFGNSPELRVSSSKFSRAVSYLLFEIEGALGDIKSARVKLRVNDTGPDGGTIYPVSNNYNDRPSRWREDKLVWKNAPVLPPFGLSSVNAIQTGFVEFDVTESIHGDGVYSFAIKSGSPDKVLFGSRESLHPPVLLIETTLDPESISLLTGVDTQQDATPEVLPDKLAITANYPNPFNLETTIQYSLPVQGDVSLIVYNLVGQEVKVLVDKNLAGGKFSARWDGRDASGREVASGIYFVRLRAAGRSALRKIALQK